jgi:hypothetical protein
MLCDEDCRTAVLGRTERTVGWEGDGELIMTGLDVCFISSLPVMQRPACTAWADKKPAQIVGAESQTMLAPDVVDDVSG